MFITNKNISESLVRSLQNSFTSQTNCEITLMCEGKTLKCHRHVLVLHSTHFSNLFKEQTDFPKAIAVVNMKFTHLKAMVDYMYFGRIKLQEDTDEMKQIIKCAEDLGLSALVTFITEFLKSSSKHKANQLNGSSANLSSSELNGDDSLMKRKRASDANSSRIANDSFKKPKLNESGPKSSTPLREPSKATNKSTVTSDVKVSNSDNSETLIIDKKRKSDDDEADDEETKRRVREEEEERKRKLKEEDERKKKKQEEEERKRREEEKQRLEEERCKKAEDEKRKAEEIKRKAEEAERIKIEEERKKKALEKKKEEEEAARKAEEERNKKETTKCDESASTKSCAVCNKQYKDNIDHRKVLEGITFEKKCIINGCSKSLPFRRALIDHLLKAHKIDVCDHTSNN